MRILQITDLHILPESGRTLYGLDTFTSLQAVVEKAFSDAPPPDLIIATGDLAEDGSVTSYRRLRSILEKININIFVVPGNHDSVEAMKKGLLSEKIQMKNFYSTENWNFIFMNSKVPGQDYGKLEINELNFLKKIAESAPEKPVLVAFHHSSLTLCPHPGCQLKAREEFFELLDSHSNIKCVISGHAHEDAHKQHAEADLFTTPATSLFVWHDPNIDSLDPNNFWASHSVDNKRSGYRILDLSNEGKINSQVHWLS